MKMSYPGMPLEKLRGVSSSSQPLLIPKRQVPLPEHAISLGSWPKWGFVGRLILGDAGAST